MRTRSKLWLLLPVAMACSGAEPTSTEIKPDFDVMCSPPRANVIAGPPVTRVKNSDSGTKFTVKNNCNVGLDLTLTTSRTGAVASVGAPSPTTMTLAPGTAKAAFVTYHTGSPGTGTVVLTATTELGDVSWGTLQVTVTNEGFGSEFASTD
jgi:hypothetical protein